MPSRYYLTTPIYYVNDVPHVGTSYTTVAADILARFHRLCGAEVLFATGTDENATKVVQAARDRGLERYVTEQPPYSILVRAIETEVLPTCARYGMGVLSDSPLTGGWLSGRWRKASGQQSSSRANRLPERFDLSRPANQHKLDAVEELAQLAEQGGSPPSSWRSRSSSATPPSPQRSSGPGPWSSWSARSPQPRWSWTRRCWTASTSSSRPARPSTQPTTPGPTQPCSQRHDAANAHP